MEEVECPPVTVEGDWSPGQTKALRNKLQLYFQSRRRSGGGDCRVEAEDGAPRAAVYFRSEEVRARVLARENHEVILDNQTVRLRLISAPSPEISDGAAGSSTDPKSLKPEIEPGASAESKDESDSSQSISVVLDNIVDDMSVDFLSMLVENISGVEDGGYSLEIIWETNRTVISFNSPADVERFLAASHSSQKLQKHGLTVRQLEAAKSVRVESLPPNINKDMLELYFEKCGALSDAVVMIPQEQAAIMTFSDPKAVKNICLKQDHMLRSIPIKVYPYYESLGTALYGKDRPTWKLPQPFMVPIHHVVWKFIQKKTLWKSINHQMRPYFCNVDLRTPEVKLSPVPGFLRQKGLTSKHVDMWMCTVQEAFQKQMFQYTAFECAADAPVWKAAEKDIRSVVREDAILLFDASRRILTVVGQADFIQQIKASVENIVLRATSLIRRQTETISEEIVLSTAMFYILKQDGLQKAAQNISPEMSCCYDEGRQKLTMTGLPAEVYQAKAWILERNMNMSKKHIDVAPGLLDFLQRVDPMAMSQDLFTSQGISAIYTIDNKRVFLLGSSDSVLDDAENKMKAALTLQTLVVEDQEVLKLPDWASLRQQLLDSYNSTMRKTVVIHIHPERQDKIMVAGFLNPVKEVYRNLKEFIVNYSRVQETISVKSCAVVQFIYKKRRQDWSRIAAADQVMVRFDEERPKIKITGARLHVQKAKSSFQKLESALYTDEFTVDKPGAKKYFQSQGSMFLSTIMSEFSCVVVLRPDSEEEEEDDWGVANVLCYCKVQTVSGVLVYVRKADICSHSTDAVVNAANEDLQHIGGVAFALLKAAGPELQKVCNDYTAKHGKLHPGNATVTDAYNLPCKYVVHAVGPRFSDYDKKTSVSFLKLAVQESLRQAEKVGCSTIALPAISSGVFGFPLDLCTDTIAQAVREYCDRPGSPTSLAEIHLVDNNDNTVRALASAVNKEFADLGPTMTVPQQAGNSSIHQWGRGRGQGQSQSQSSRRPFFSERGGRGGRGYGGDGGGRGGGKGHRGDGGGGGQGGRGGGGRGGGASWTGGGAGWTGAGPQGGRQGNRGGQSFGGNSRPGAHGGPGRMEQTTTEGLKVVLQKGNIQHQTTDVIVNTISESMNLNQGAVSTAILQEAGPGLQPAVQSEAGMATLPYGHVVITDSFNLKCKKVFHAVCPLWDNGGGQAEKELTSIVRYCLEETEKRQMASLSFPAIGTGNLGFPRDVVCRVLLREIHLYSCRTAGQHLREVAIVVHPGDNQTVDCFTREFKGERSVRQEAQESSQAPVGQSVSQSQQAAASFSQVTSPSLGVYQMQMGQLLLEVSSGDITREACDVIVNSSNNNFTLRSGVSKAILDSAGHKVEQECADIVNSHNYKPRPLILTSAGSLPSRNIIHVVGTNDPAKIKQMVNSVLKFCEESAFTSVSFPALGTGQGGASPSAVADAMVEAVVEFVRKKHAKSIRSVKILIFQATMVTEFHKSMKKREGEEVEEKTIISRIKDSVTSFFMGSVEERPGADGLVLDRAEFEPTVFQLCADNEKAVRQVKKRIEELIVAEQAKRTITDPFISQLSQADMQQLRALQKELGVIIHLDTGVKDQEPNIYLEGLTRDVHTAESVVRDIIRKVERTENLRNRALLVKGLVEWQHQLSDGTMVAFDIHTNLSLEEALEKKQSVKISVNDETYIADPKMRRATSADQKKVMELLRKDMKVDAALPSQWDDMKGSLLKLVPLTAGTFEYDDVKQELEKTGLTVTIVSIERVQNPTLWQSYQLKKKEMEAKNKHTNNEKRLFHGTKAASIELINKQGFNRSYAGTHGAMYGKGSYFAVDPAYSVKNYTAPDTNGHKHVYLARVLVGDFTQGANAMITPPPRSAGNAADPYDSVTDNTTTPAMFVVFSDIQAYPEHLITFT